MPTNNVMKPCLKAVSESSSTKVRGKHCCDLHLVPAHIDLGFENMKYQWHALLLGMTRLSLLISLWKHFPQLPALTILGSGDRAPHSE